MNPVQEQDPSGDFDPKRSRCSLERHQHKSSATKAAERSCETHVVYCLYDPADQYCAIRYVGYSRFPAARLEQHANCADQGNPFLLEWLRGLRSAGLRPEMRVLEYTDARGWARCERKWIARMRGTPIGHILLNIEDGGRSPKPSKHKPQSVRQRKRKPAKRAYDWLTGRYR